MRARRWIFIEILPVWILSPLYRWFQQLSLSTKRSHALVKTLIVIPLILDATTDEKNLQALLRRVLIGCLVA